MKITIESTSKIVEFQWRGQREWIPLDVADELGDVLAYAALLAERLGISLEQATLHKFHQVSARKGWTGWNGRDETDVR